MKKKLLIGFVLLLQISVAQNTVGTLSITNDSQEAYTLFSVFNKSYLINNCGEVINEWTSNYRPGASVYLLPNGNLLRAGQTDQSTTNVSIGGRGGIVELFNWDGNLLWSYQYSDTNFAQHHDVYPLPNGNVLMLAITIMSESETLQAGRDPSLIFNNELYNEQILELQPIGSNFANVVWEWNVKDHLIQDFDNTKDNFGMVEDNPQLLDINYVNSNNPNWLHVNSIQYDEARDQIILSSRLLSEIWIIDHSTTTAEAASHTGGVYGKGGDFLYRWGNPEVYRRGTASDRVLFGQHYPHYIESGFPNENKIIIFNNGFQRTPDFSQVDIISPPESTLGVYDYTPGTAYLPTSTDYTYTDFSSDPSEFFSGIVSGAQQLSNGNILVCEGREGYFFEIDSNNNKVWEYINPVDNNTGGISNQFTNPPSTNITFRAIKYTPDYAAFTGRDLTPGAPIEGNPDLAPCNNLSVEDLNTFAVNIYPNPTKNSISIHSKTPIEKLEIYNTSGQKLGETTRTTLDLLEYSNGIYLLRIFSDSNSITKRIVKI